MAIEKKAILQFLKQKGDWVESKVIAEMFHVSTRTIRNQVKKINEQANYDLVLSSYKGYCLSNQVDNLLWEQAEKKNDRENYIIRKLLCCTAVDLYKLADELYISDSTMELELKKCKKILANFNLDIKRKRNLLSLEGYELDKRKLMKDLISKENVNDFICSYNEILTEGNDTDFLILCQQLHHLFISEGLYVNDYELNNIAVHIIIAITRIRTVQSIQENVEIGKVMETHDYRVSLKIKETLKEQYSIEMNDAELYYLTLLVSANSSTVDDSFITMTNITQYIEEEFIYIAKVLIQRLCEAYYLDEFDEQFLIKFSIHIKNLCYRLKNHVQAKNPLSFKIKKDYPLVYDMAVYVAKELKAIGYDCISDDEIAFLAFHIGAYLENDKNRKERYKCCFIYTNYHEMYQKSLDAILHYFNTRIIVNKVLSFQQIDQIPCNTDLIITMTDISEYSSLPTVSIGPFLSQNDLKSIEKKLRELEEGYHKKMIDRNLRKFVGEQLFFKEMYADSVEQMIEILCENCVTMNLCDTEYVQKVLEREKMSSTSFPNRVAVPHSLLRSARKSFLSIVINERSMKWGEFDVNLIILIGFGKDDQEAFTELFDKLIAVLYEQSNVNRLLKCKKYTEFLSQIEDMLISS